MAGRKTKEVWEFGDFQTPDSLASEAIEVIKRLGFSPQSIIEPTCGRGSFLLAAVRAFNYAKKFLGVDINKAHLSCLQERIFREAIGAPITILHADFFTLDWPQILKDLPQPILIIGNPPWVTNTELAKLDSFNLPDKSNFQNRRGVEAITGKSNFDISEWMLLQYLQWLKERNGFVAVLCKTAVARKMLVHAWKHEFRLTSSRIYLIDAMTHFNAAVDACFFIMERGDRKSPNCDIYDSLHHTTPSRTLGYHDETILADVERYLKWRHLRGTDSAYTWRSGIKHDCAEAVELERREKSFYNRRGIAVDIEDRYVYPMYKSSDIVNGNVPKLRKYMVVTQKYIGEDTAHIKKDAPQTWEYLISNAESFSKRRSSIYKNRPPFSIFGVGDYTFAPWKVAVSGFYKHLKFACIGPADGRPAIFDDTVYFLPCWSKQEAIFLTDMLNSKPAQEFLLSMIFGSDKRPITIDLLKRLNLHALSVALDRESEYLAFAGQRKSLQDFVIQRQLSLDIAENTP
jgi:hypothetical protein